MAESQTGQEKTERATPKRLADTRKKGDVARSRELNTTVVLLASALCLAALGASMLSGLERLIKSGLDVAPQELASGDLQRHLAEAIGAGIWVLAPVFAVMLLASVIGPAMTGGIVFRVANAAPKLSKLNPASGLKRIFGPQGLMELLKALAKFALVLGVATLVIWAARGSIFALGNGPLLPAMAASGDMLVYTFVAVAASLIVVAGIDVPFQLWQFQKKLRMTRQEVKDELKETEGRPEVKSRIRQLQQEAARQRVAAEMPTATVLIVNPVHFGVALRYDEGERAPIVVAKGTDGMVERMRDLARTYNVPVVSAPPLARALYYSTRAGREVPAELYAVVARVLAWVFEVSRRPNARIPLPAVGAGEIPEAMRR